MAGGHLLMPGTYHLTEISLRKAHLAEGAGTNAMHPELRELLCRAVVDVAVRGVPGEVHSTVPSVLESHGSSVRRKPFISLARMVIFEDDYWQGVYESQKGISPLHSACGMGINSLGIEFKARNKEKASAALHLKATHIARRILQLAGIDITVLRLTGQVLDWQDALPLHDPGTKMIYPPPFKAMKEYMDLVKNRKEGTKRGAAA